MKQVQIELVDGSKCMLGDKEIERPSYMANDDASIDDLVIAPIGNNLSVGKIVSFETIDLPYVRKLAYNLSEDFYSQMLIREIHGSLAIENEVMSREQIAIIFLKEMINEKS